MTFKRIPIIKLNLYKLQNEAKLFSYVSQVRVVVSLEEMWWAVIDAGHILSFDLGTIYKNMLSLWIYNQFYTCDLFTLLHVCTQTAQNFNLKV